MWIRGAADLPSSGQPALPPEPQPVFAASQVIQRMSFRLLIGTFTLFSHK